LIKNVSNQSVGDYLIDRLHNYGIRHIFGVPGDYILGFYQQLNQSNKIKIINTCDEQGAGFAADAYARINGLGVACVTYCVGGLKVVNSTAQAFAEKSPLVIISGAPGINERLKNPLLHHKVKDFDTQRKIFEHITVDSIILDNTQTAAQNIDRVLSSAIYYKKPIYIEIPRDIILQSIVVYPQNKPYSENNNNNPYLASEIKSQIQEENLNIDSMNEALTEAIAMISSSKKPVIVVGVEIHRFKLQQKLLHLIDKTNIPFVTTVLSKSVLSENHPLFLGLYEGAMGFELVRQYVESSDCLILFGAPMIETDFSITPTPISQSHSIFLTSENITIKHHRFDYICFQDFLDALINSLLIKRETDIEAMEIIKNKKYKNNLHSLKNNTDFRIIKGQKITIKHLFERLNFSIADDTIIIADVGDSLFGSLDLTIHNQTEFLSSAYYLSMGFAVPAIIGAKLANPDLRPIAIVGDGAFQMTGMEISTIARFDLNPIIIVLNNHGYGTERLLLEGSFNDILSWNYSLIPKILGKGRGFIIETEDQLDDALNSIEEIFSQELCILDVRLGKDDISYALQRLTNILSKKISK
jgi:TPP-dependent 2-oxoacid decarboxylase